MILPLSSFNSFEVRRVDYFSILLLQSFLQNCFFFNSVILDICGDITPLGIDLGITICKQVNLFVVLPTVSDEGILCLLWHDF